jgi:hypothetical protein
MPPASKPSEMAATRKGAAGGGRVARRWRAGGDERGAEAVVGQAAAELKHRVEVALRLWEGEEEDMAATAVAVGWAGVRLHSCLEE